jgi:hypothetical protein
MRRSWIWGRCGFHTLTLFSGMISWSTVTQFSLTIYGSVVTYRFSQFHASSMTLFLLSIWCIGREFIDAVDCIRQLSLSFQWRLQGVQWLCFRWWFMDQQWHNVLHNSMRQPWLYFCYRFDASVVNSLTLLIPYGSYHSVFIDDFKVCSDSVFADDLWISSDIVFLTIPCVSYDFIFAIGLMCRSWIHLRYGFHTSAVTQFWMMISCPTATQFSLTIYGSVMT